MNASNLSHNITQTNEAHDQRYQQSELGHVTTRDEEINQTEIKDVHRSQQASVDISNLGDTFVNLNQLEEKDLKIAISKLRKQNDELRDQLKDLNDKLTGVLKKSKSKLKMKDEKPQEFKEDTLAREIENSKQQIVQYKKEMQHLRNRLELCSSEDRISKLETILKQRDQMLQDLTIENKNLQKINRDQEKEIDAYHKEHGFEQKVNACTEEVTALREKMRDVQETSRITEKNFKKQQEYLTNLNHQYALVCERIGIQTAFTFSKVEELNLHLAQKSGNGNVNQTEIKREPKNENQSKIFDPKKIKEMEDTIRDLQVKEDILQKQLQSLDRKNTLVLNKLKNEVTDAQSKVKEIETRVQSKEQEITTLDGKVVELKQVAKKNTVAMLDAAKTVETEPATINQASSTRQFTEIKPLKPDQKSSLPNLQQVTKDVPINTIQTKPKEIQEVPTIRDVVGGRTGAGLFDFSDKDVLENLFSTKIVKLTLWLGEDFINGIQASYKVNNTEDVVGNQHLAAEMKGRTRVVESIQIDHDDRISLIAGKYNEGLICLKLQTAQGKIKTFGDDKSPGEDFEIDMETGEQPTLLFGALCKKKDSKGKEEIVLANIGFTLVKRNKY